MNFTKAVFYELAEGTGTSVVDTLGNGPAGTIAGTTTNIWSNAGAFTIDNATHASGVAGDNAIKVQDAYIDAMMDLTTLEGSSLVLMYMLNQPQVPTGTKYIMSYGDVGSNTDGAYAVSDQNQLCVYSVRGGATSEFGGAITVDPILTAQNNTWVSYGYQLDLFNGKLVSSGYANGNPGRGCRIFNLEATLPRVAANGCGIRLLARGSGVTGAANFMWGQTQIKRVFIARTNGDQRHNIPVWCNAYYNDTAGTVPFMVS